MSDTPQLPARRERPWLIPSNRKLRHLQSITLRNLALSSPDTKAGKRKILDDEGLPTTLKTQSKLLSLREGKGLGHSRSSTDLRPIHEAAHDDSAQSGRPIVNGTPNEKEAKQKTPPRPSLAKLRRRSTMEWVNASAHQRQKKLEDVSASRMADIFFSLHVAGLKEPVYVSEIAAKAMNPNFKNIQVDGCGPAVVRADSVVLKFWVKSENMSDYQLLLDMSLSLRSLQFIGKSLASFHHPFPPNSVIFQLTDGFYTCFTDAQVDEPLDPFLDQPTKTATSRPLPTSSFDALLRLSKLDDSIQDALALRNRFAAELAAILEDSKDARSDKVENGEANDFLKTIDFATATVQKQLTSLRQKRDEKRSSLQSRRDLLDRSRASQQQVLTSISASQSEFESFRTQHTALTSSISAQRRRICTDLSKIYPITPIRDRQLAFKIRKLHLPNSEDLDSVPPDQLAAALGHVAHVLQLLSFYLGAVLPYPPHPRSSTSSISDPISTLNASQIGKASSASPFAGAVAGTEARRFPLFSKGAVRFRFEYAVFLLNKDIEILLATTFGVRVLDIRQTLPNLLYAIYCATAGEGELPARKAGGVRGLIGAGRESHEGTEGGEGVKGGASAVQSLKRNEKVRDSVLKGAAVAGTS